MNDIEDIFHDKNTFADRETGGHKSMILIQCVDSKKDKKLPARDLYDSAYFDAMERYAEAYCREYDETWGILSAKHGLVDPDEELEPYDEFGLTGTQAVEVATELSTKNVDSVRVIAGKKYTDPLTPALEGVGIDVVEICRGMRIGNRVQKLDELVRSLENETLC